LCRGAGVSKSRRKPERALLTERVTVQRSIRLSSFQS
jgi:hypothetical protein